MSGVILAMTPVFVTIMVSTGSMFGVRSAIPIVVGDMLGVMAVGRVSNVFETA